MFCINPIHIEGRGIFPCGQCRCCRVMRSNTWAMRMVHESMYWKSKAFITLTYNEENLPEGGNLDKKELQKFLKRVRKSIHPQVIKYFACGEYGETYGRPHYHLITFGLGVEHRDIVERCWKLGFIKVDRFSKSNARYVTKYVTKAPLGRSRLDKIYFDKELPFQIQSRGIGLRWLEENVESFGKRGILVHGKSVCVPRYYHNKARDKGVSNQVFEDIKATRMQESIEFYRKWLAEGRGPDELTKRNLDIRAMRIEEIKTIDSMHRFKDDQ